MATTDPKPLKHCSDCKRSMVAKHSWNTGNKRGAETYWHDVASGMCRACSARAKRRANPGPPRTCWAKGKVLGNRAETEDLLNEYDLIRADVSSIAAAAERLGIKVSRLDQMLYRARKRDDPRGRPPLEQFERALDRGAPYGRPHPRNEKRAA